MTIKSEQRTVWLTSLETECETEQAALEQELEETFRYCFDEAYAGDGEYTFEGLWDAFRKQFKGTPRLHPELPNSDDLLVLICKVYAFQHNRPVTVTIGLKKAES